MYMFRGLKHWKKYVVITLILAMTVLSSGLYAVPLDAKGIQAFTPKSLSAEFVPETGTEPKGSVKLTMTIANLPGATNDATLNWYVSIEK